MAKTTKTAWGIDVGNCTLKAIKLSGWSILQLLSMKRYFRSPILILNSVPK